MPRYLTLAPFSITSPARGAATVTVSVDVKAAVYERYVKHGEATINPASTAAASRTGCASRSRPTWSPTYPERLKLPDAP